MENYYQIDKCTINTNLSQMNELLLLIILFRGYMPSWDQDKSLAVLHGLSLTHTHTGFCGLNERQQCSERSTVCLSSSVHRSCVCVDRVTVE